MTVCELRNAAAKVIEERGWCQREFSDDDGAVCMLGAMNVAIGLDPWGCGPLSAVVDARVVIKAAVDSLCLPDVHDDWGVEDWNDAPERTQAEVIARLVDGCEE